MCAKLFLDPRLFNKLDEKEIDPTAEIIFNWASLLHYLGLENIFANFPKFDDSNPLFVSYIEALKTPTEKRALYDLYDHLFKECLIQVKTIEQLDPAFLIERIESAKIDTIEPIARVLEQYEFSFKHDLQNTMHSLILYLSWDRFCICLAHLFDYQSTDVTFLHNLDVFRECLIESFDHIKKHGRTNPSFFRLMEALFFYQMREEKIQTHKEEDWHILNQGFSVFNVPDTLFDTPHTTVTPFPNEEAITFLTLDSAQVIQSHKDLTCYFLKIVNHEVPDFHYHLLPTTEA